MFTLNEPALNHGSPSGWTSLTVRDPGMGMLRTGALIMLSLSGEEHSIFLNLLIPKLPAPGENSGGQREKVERWGTLPTPTN